jgi:hypothetical protein
VVARCGFRAGGRRGGLALGARSLQLIDLRDEFVQMVHFLANLLAIEAESSFSIRVVYGRFGLTVCFRLHEASPSIANSKDCTRRTPFQTSEN